MKTRETNILGVALKDFFYRYLAQLRGMSPPTILNYRDSLKLFLQFLIEQENISVSELTVEIDSDAEDTYLQGSEKNCEVQQDGYYE
ncbi:hypothetical protein ES703_95788 [subsurface metagenome]